MSYRLQLPENTKSTCTCEVIIAEIFKGQQANRITRDTDNLHNAFSLDKELVFDVASGHIAQTR